MKKNYIELANAIILQAVKDYRKAQRKKRNKPNDFLAARDIKSIERFFGSEWFRMLTDLNSDVLLKKLKAEVVL